MIRIALIAAVAAFAASSASASEVRVSLVGKSAEQINADILDAARTVCAKDVADETMILGAYGRCVKATMQVTKQNSPPATRALFLCPRQPAGFAPVAARPYMTRTGFP